MKTALYMLAIAALATPAAIAQQAPEGTPPAVVLTPVDMAEVAPAELRGADVMGADGEEIGQITAIVFTSTGEMGAAVISTGGFLGFGRHSVAIPLEQLSVSTPPDASGEMVVRLPLTEEELKEMPEVGAESMAEE